MSMYSNAVPDPGRHFLGETRWRRSALLPRTSNLEPRAARGLVFGPASTYLQYECGLVFRFGFKAASGKWQVLVANPVQAGRCGIP